MHDIRALVADVVELEQQGIVKPAVDTTRTGELRVYPADVSPLPWAPRLSLEGSACQPVPSGPCRRAAAMAIAADHVAACDLTRELLHVGGVGKQLGDVCSLAPDVVELEYADVGFAAVRATMRAQMREDQLAGSSLAAPFRALNLFDV